MYNELYRYLDQIIEMNVPRWTRHQQSLPSNFMNKQNNQQNLPKPKPTSYRKTQVIRLENLVSETVRNIEVNTKSPSLQQETLMQFKLSKA